VKTSETVGKKGRRATHEYQGGVEVLVVLLDVVGNLLCRLPPVHGVEVETGIVGLDGLKESSEGILEATSNLRLAMQTMSGVTGVRCTTGDQFSAEGIPFRSWNARHRQRLP